MVRSLLKCFRCGCCRTRKWLVEGIIRGINGIWSSYCRPGTSTQRTNWSAGIPVCLLPSKFTFPCLCAFSCLTKSHPAICIVKAEKQVRGAIWMYRQQMKSMDETAYYYGDAGCAFCTFLHRPVGWLSTGLLEGIAWTYEKSLWLQILFFLLYLGPEEKQVWEIWECWFSCVSPALYSIRFRGKVSVFQGT